MPDAPLPKTDAEILHLAAELRLKAEALLASAHGSWRPAPIPPVPGLHAFSTPFGGIDVNSYAVVDPSTGKAAAFDTGSDCSDLLALGLRIEKIFLTHIHGDHIFDLDRLIEKTGAEAFANALEPLAGTTPFHAPAEFEVGNLRIRAIPTPGHARGGTTYFCTGLQRPVAFTGDALFAGSMGGAGSHWNEALHSLREKILSLPDETILCPGHGPATTVAEEKPHNPFA